jgi:arylsulfatase A-like enzyme
MSIMRYLNATILTCSLLLAFGTSHAAPEKNKPLNYVVIFVDDLGYGDIGPFGSQLNKTPHLDRMAAEGRKFTNFYVAAAVCTPSRAALMTACYPQRVDMALNALPNSVNNIVLFPGDPKGLNPHEVTIAEVLKDKSYATACIGKWHLGDQRAFLPTEQGFDYYFGIPFSNDMGFDHRIPYPPLPLLRNEEVIEEEPDQRFLTKRYTEETLAFIEQHQQEPFFVYLPHSMVHWPHYASPAFKDKSKNGIYGDVVEEIDWSVGKILDKLAELDLDERTLVIFTSDNGGGGARGCVVSNLPLRARKGNMCEGGIRVCTIAWCPGLVPKGTVCDELATAMDLLPTFANLSGAKLPEDRILDGKDILPLLRGDLGAKSPHEAFYYRRGMDLYAVRSGDWKLFVRTNQAPFPGGNKAQRITAGTLYNLNDDIGETTDVSAQHPDVVAKLERLAEASRVDLGDGTDRPGNNVRRAAYVDVNDAVTLTNFEQGFVPVFNGRNLDGWRTVPANAAGAWQAKEGVIHGEGKEDRLVYLVYAGDEQLKDFELKFRYRMVTKGNTGVEVRARIDATGKRPLEGYHADFGHVGIGPQILGAWDFHFGNGTRQEPPCPRGTRLLIDEDGSLRSERIENGVELDDINEGDWNEGHITAKGNKLQFFINGKLASEFTDNIKQGRLESGLIGLQLHDKGMIVQFKDLFLKKL